MTSQEICSTVHELLRPLPLFERPEQVPITDGLCFFYEQGETSRHAPEGRIVRVGNHPQSAGNLVPRLRYHYTQSKNSSVFRRYLGGALMRAEDPHHPCLAPAPGKGHWEKQKGKCCHLCQPVEQSVSCLLKARFRFRCVSIADRTKRNRFEKALIASLAGCPVCRPSHAWLGLHAYPDAVRCTGMWNVRGVGSEPMSGTDLRQFEAAAASTPRA